MFLHQQLLPDLQLQSKSNLVILWGNWPNQHFFENGHVWSIIAQDDSNSFPIEVFVFCTLRLCWRELSLTNAICRLCSSYDNVQFSPSSPPRSYNLLGLVEHAAQSLRKRFQCPRAFLSKLHSYHFLTTCPSPTQGTEVGSLWRGQTWS